MRTIIVTEKFNDKKLSYFLMNSFSGLTQSLFYKTLRKKDIRINNVRINKDIILHSGDEIKIYLIDDLLFKTFKPDIVYEDNNILIVNKPTDMETTGENSLTQNLKDFFNNIDSTAQKFIEPCHRLDRNTTGLVLFAKNEDSLQIILNKFKNHEIEKHYLATVYGIPKVLHQTLTAYLFKDSKKSLVYISDEPKTGYVQIITSYSVVKTFPEKNYSILDVCLHTGKTHQIRAHLAHIGHPILGDGKYGNNQINKQYGYKTQQLCSYILQFNFKTDAGILNYLNGKMIKLKD